MFPFNLSYSKRDHAYIFVHPANNKSNEDFRYIEMGTDFVDFMQVTVDEMIGGSCTKLVINHTPEPTDKPPP